MALAVILIVVDIIHGRIRQTVVAWLAMVSLIYSEPTLIVWRHSWDQSARHWIPAIVMIVALLLILRDVLRHRVGWNVFMWAAVVITTLVVWPLSSNPFYRVPSQWVWQLVLVPIGVVLAAGPLWKQLRNHPAPRLEDRVEAPALIS